MFKDAGYIIMECYASVVSDTYTIKVVICCSVIQNYETGVHLRWIIPQSPVTHIFEVMNGFHHIVLLTFPIIKCTSYNVS